MNYSNLVNTAAFETALNTIRTSEATIRDNLNEWGPQAIEGVFAGDNIAQVNNLIACFGGIRAKRLKSVINTMLPFDTDKDTGAFSTKSKSEKVIAKKAAAFEAFMTSNDTLYGLLETVKQAEKKPVDTLANFKKAAKAAIDDGITADQLIAILNATVAAKLLEAPAEEKAA